MRSSRAGFAHGEWYQNQDLVSCTQGRERGCQASRRGAEGLWPSYKSDQGRYARMFAFWSIGILMIYGASVLAPWLRGKENLFPVEGGTNWFSQNLLGRPDGRVPIIGFYLYYANLLVLGLVLLFLWWWHRFLTKPNRADLLIDTESELKKVTWPSWPETWSSTMVVIGTVIFLLVFLAIADWALGSVARFLLF